MWEFAAPDRLWGLTALPALWLLSRYTNRRRARDWAALGQPGRPTCIRLGWELAGLATLCVALAGPRWGFVSEPPLPPGRDVVVAIDTSRSMAALDAVPDRLGVAVAAARGLVAALGQSPGDRVAVVAFAGRGVLKCPLTANLGAADQALVALRPGMVHPGGTDLGAALEASLDAFDDRDHSGGRAVVVFSDGEDHSRRWQAATARLKARGVVVHAVAIGDDQHGRTVPLQRGDSSEILQYAGAPVLSMRTDAALAAIARATGGAFVPLGLAAIDLGPLFLHRIDPVAQRYAEAARASRWRERFGLFLLAALGFSVAASWQGRLPARTRPILAWVLICVIGMGANPTTDPARVVAEGRAAFAAGRFEAALAAFRRAESLAPRSPLPRYNAASTLFQLGRFTEAQAAYHDARAVTADNSLLRTKIDYALGNVALALGNPAVAIAHYDDCLASPVRTVEAEQVRRDALENRRFAEQQQRPEPETTESDATPKPDPKGQGPSDAKPSPPTAGAPPASGGPPSASDSQRRGEGGAGGDGPAPARAGTPEDQLAKALDNVRDARRRRLADDDTEVIDADRKDW